MLPLNSYILQWGWAVLDSLWQFGLIYLLYAGIRYAAGKHLKAAGTFWLLLGSISAGATLFIYNILQPFYGQTYTPAITRWQLPAVHTPWLYYLLAGTGIIYLAISAARLLLMAARLLKPGKKQGHEQGLLGTDFEQYLAELCGWLKIRTPRLRFSRQAVTPYVTGLLKHIIVIPASLVNQLTAQEMEAVILHELAHIKRLDTVTNLLVLVAEQLLWFNPFTRELIRQLRQQREMACDDRVLQMGVKPMHYATSLHKVAVLEACPAAWRLPMSVQKGELLHRVERLFKHHSPQPYRINKKPFWAVPVLLLVLVLAGRQVPPAVPAAQYAYNVPAIPARYEMPVSIVKNDLPAATQKPVKRIALPAATVIAIKKQAPTEAIATTEAPLTEVRIIPVADKTSEAETAYTTFVNEGSHRSQDVVMKFTDSLLVFENFISRQNMESSTANHLVAMLNLVAGIQEKLAANPEQLRIVGMPAKITVSQNGAPNLYFNNAVLQQEAVYYPAAKEWKIRFVLLNGDQKLGERYINIYRKQVLKAAVL